ncbi:MAG TPA: hypothetical protein VFJ30_07745 [Phycisphaerae bacterium]|nr:hypothetical protein [Phycisphaerae bacterium]
MRTLSTCAVAGLLAILVAGGNADAEAAAAASAATRPALSHPFLLFDAREARTLAGRAGDDELLKECWDAVRERAEAPDSDRGWTRQLEARALLWQVSREKAMADRGIAQMLAALERVDPAEYYKRSDFHVHGAPLRALALGWDWLYEAMTPAQRAAALPGLARWCRAAFADFETRWWREASYNCGAIGAGGIGLLTTAIAADTNDPAVHTAHREMVRRVGQNFFPVSWKPSGICWEGPNYAIVGYRYVAPFAEALRRTGGPDLLARSGARHAMAYLMHQWLPAGGCAPIGDNTSYGRRTFAAEYLLGLGRTGDAEGLWTWRRWTDRDDLDPVIAAVWHPAGLVPRSPAEAGTPTSRYFEVTANRAGYLFARGRWDDADTPFFSFVIRHEMCNHQHYDMNSVLLGGLGTTFATHRDLWPYGHENHGYDLEHNHVVLDGGGWPAEDKTGSCANQCSTGGLVVGLALGGSADYVRGDAKWSYRDNSIPNTDPAIRAERACLFVKAGPTPYLVMVDDIQYRGRAHRYDWLWHAPSLPIAGAGTPGDPLTITAEKGRCAIRFLTPAAPAVTVADAAQQATRRRRGDATPIPPLRRIAVAQTGTRVQYAAVATIEAAGAAAPTVAALPVECGAPVAGGVRIDHPDGTVDRIVWQSEEQRVQLGVPLSAGKLATDGLLAMVRLDKAGAVVAYVLGEGTHLSWDGKDLVRAASSVCVTADGGGVNVTGRQRSRKGLPPEPPTDARTFTPAGS